MANVEIFELHLQKAEELIDEIKDKELYTDNLNKINDDINTLKKQFNKIETFESTLENTIYKENLSDAIKIIKISKKTFIINKKSIT